MPVLAHGEHEASERVLRGLRLAVEFSILILVIESVGAIFSRSLALTVDAVHNIPDIIAFVISWAALRGTQQGSSSEFTFGTHRFEVFAGLLNGAVVLGAGLLFGYEAVVSLGSRVPFAGTVDATWLLAAAIPTLLLRVTNLAVLRRLPGRIRDMNLRSVIVHLAGDLAITAALVVTGLVLLVDPAVWWIDPAAALGIAAVLVYESYPIFREGLAVLTERTPAGLSVEAITRSARSVPGVAELHDVHIWSVCSTLVCLTAHVGIREMPMRDGLAVVASLRERMESEFGIVHATFELEIAPGS